MKTVADVLLFGSLGREDRSFSSRRLHLELQTPTPLPDLLERLHIQDRQVQVAMVNYKAVPPDHIVRPGDRVSLFPREYPIFADWKNFRR